MATTVTARGRLDMRELVSLPTLYHPTLSYKRDRVAFYWDTTGRIELHVLDLATRAVRQLTHGEAPRALRSFFEWSRDDRAIVFARDDAGDENHDLYRVDVATGAVTRLTRDPKSEKHAIEFSPDGRWLTVNANARPVEALERPAQMNVWILSADGAQFKPLTRYGAPAGGGLWSPDGARLIYNATEEPPGTRNRDGYVMNADGTGAKRVFRVTNGSVDVFRRWLPDGKRAVIQSDSRGTDRVGIFDLASGEARWLGSEGVEESFAGLSPSGRALAVVRDADAAGRLVVYDVATGTERVAPLAPGVVGNVDFIDDDRAVVLHATSATRPSIVLVDLAHGTSEALLPASYGTIDPATFVEAQHIRYRSFDGLEIPALLYQPRGLAAGERRPAIVQVHGGPTGQWSRSFDQLAQVLVDLGYVVIQPNPRGSTGYGVAFRDAALRDWGGKDLEDIAHARAYLAAQSYVDSERIGVMGGSYGGFMSFIAVTKKPDLWKVGIPSYGICDLHAMWAESKESFRWFLRTQMGDPVTDRALWRDRSAIEFADRVSAKLLIVHGTNDPRCPVSQSRMFVAKLRELGKREGQDFTYVEHDDEGHGSVDIAAKVRRFSRVVDFLDAAL